jgi:ribonuclease Z
MVEVMVLGLGGMMPMPGRFLTTAALRHNGQVSLFDCGEGTQVPLKSSGFGIARIGRFILSHLHADHLTGIPGMLMLLAQAEPDHEVDIIGLPEVIHHVRQTRRTLRFYLSYELRYHDLDPQGGVMPGDGFSLHYLPLDHTIPTLGFAYVENRRPGRFSVEKAQSLAVPEGPLWGELQRGHAVEVGGRRVTPAQVLGPPRRGRKFAYVTDTAPCDNALNLLADADLAVVEGMFTDEHATEAAEKKHLTVRQAAVLVKESGCARALLGHVSPRYRNNDLDQLETEAKEVCERAELAKPLERYEIALPD